MNKKIKFNVLDFSIILFAILVVLSVIFWNDLRSKLAFDETQAQISFVISGVTIEEAESLLVGDYLYLSDEDIKIGEIISIFKEKEILPITLADGTSTFYESDTYKITGTFTAKGNKKENGFYMGNKFFTVNGKKIDIETSSVKMKIEVTNIYY